MKRRTTVSRFCLLAFPVALMLAAAAGVYSGLGWGDVDSSGIQHSAAGLSSSFSTFPRRYVDSAKNSSNYFRHSMRTMKRHVEKLQMLLRDEALAPDHEGFFSLKQEAADTGLSERKYVRRGGEQLLSKREADLEHDTIFVSVAAFRDVLCGQTVEELFSRAAFPQRIFVGIVQQIYPGTDEPCHSPILTNCTNRSFCPMDNIRWRRVLPHEATGPPFGRYVAGLMYQDEKYFMMIDSHSRLLPNWDVTVLKHYRMLPTKGVISFYPPAYEGQKVLKTSMLIFMCSAHFTRENILRMDGKAVIVPGKPILQPYTAAGFLFGHADFVREVPFDPYLDYIFNGEEITYTIRLWTAGWDAYLPPDAIIWHYYNRHNVPRIWNQPGVDFYRRSVVGEKRVHIILKTTVSNSTELLVDPSVAESSVLREIEKYGLGKERSLEDYWKFAMVDPIHRKTEVKMEGYCDNVRI